MKNGPLEVAKMVHFVRDTDKGVEMRSRFWMGYNQLASFLPELYAIYGDE